MTVIIAPKVALKHDTPTRFMNSDRTLTTPNLHKPGKTVQPQADRFATRRDYCLAKAKSLSINLAPIRLAPLKLHS